VKDFRRMIGDTQQQFANRLKLAISSVVRYEAGKKPDTAVLFKLAASAQDEGHCQLADIFFGAASEEIGRVVYRRAVDASIALVHAEAALRRDPPDVETALEDLRELRAVLDSMDPSRVSEEP